MPAPPSPAPPAPPLATPVKPHAASMPRTSAPAPSLAVRDGAMGHRSSFSRARRSPWNATSDPTIAATFSAMAEKRVEPEEALLGRSSPSPAHGILVLYRSRMTEVERARLADLQRRLTTAMRAGARYRYSYPDRENWEECHFANGKFVWVSGELRTAPQGPATSLPTKSSWRASSRSRPGSVRGGPTRHPATRGGMGLPRLTSREDRGRPGGEAAVHIQARARSAAILGGLHDVAAQPRAFHVQPLLLLGAAERRAATVDGRA